MKITTNLVPRRQFPVPTEQPPRKAADVRVSIREHEAPYSASWCFGAQTLTCTLTVQHASAELALIFTSIRRQQFAEPNGISSQLFAWITFHV